MDLKVIVGRFAKVHSRKSLKVNVNKYKMMMLGGEERFWSEIRVDGVRVRIQMFGVCFE